MCKFNFLIIVPFILFHGKVKCPVFNCLFFMLELCFESSGGSCGGPKPFFSRNPAVFSTVGYAL